MDSSANIHVQFHDDHNQTSDLLKKLKMDCIKSMDDSLYKSVIAMLESVSAELCKCFPFLDSAVGTLNVNFSFPVKASLSLHSTESAGKASVATASETSDAMETVPNPVSSKMKLGTLRIATRPVVSATTPPANMVQCIDLRPVQATSPYATPVDNKNNPWLEKALCQGSQTPVPASRSMSFVDLSPSPLPTPDSLVDSIYDIASSPVGKTCETPLGRGGGGTVSLFHCPRWAVAIKRIHNKKSENEAEIMKSLNHPNIVRYFGNRRIRGDFSILMEWMPGGSLKNYIKHYGPFRDNDIANYTFQLLLAVQYLHENNIVHHDIKGDNLFIGSCGELKIGDFGNAQYMEDGEVNSYLQGTVNYMAPEYICTGTFTPACDIWSIGCVMMEMGTGDPPWPSGPSLEAVAYMIGASTRSPDIPTDCASLLIRDVMWRCLQFSPDLRPSAAALLTHQAFKGLGSECHQKLTTVPDNLMLSAQVDDDHMEI